MPCSSFRAPKRILPAHLRALQARLPLQWYGPSMAMREMHAVNNHFCQSAVGVAMHDQEQIKPDSVIVAGLTGAMWLQMHVAWP